MDLDLLLMDLREVGIHFYSVLQNLREWDKISNSIISITIDSFKDFFDYYKNLNF